jgi:Putative transposase
VTGEGAWRAVRNGVRLPVRVVMAVFRGKLLAAINTAVHGGQLTLPAEVSLRQGEPRRNQRGRQQWNVPIRERSPHGAGVLTSLARYIRGGPLSNHRLVSCEQGAVTCRYRVKGEGGDSPYRGLSTWPMAEFLRRSLLHVPEPGTKVVRCYGLYAPTKGAVLAVCRAHVGQGPVVPPPALDWQTACQDRGDAPPERCPVCGRRLIRLSLIPHSQVPPPMARSSEAAA